MKKDIKDKQFGRQSESGQIVIEYVLILICCVAFSALISSVMVDRNPDSPGFVIKKWTELLKAVADDTVDQ